MNKGRYICSVCGASANCFNFDVKTCEACKAFFRRNAEFEQKHFVCKNGGNCDINESTRKQCRKCRIEKCLRVGMRKDWIMTESEREELQHKKKENRLKKLQQLQTSSLSQSNTQSFCTPQAQDHCYSLVTTASSETPKQDFKRKRVVRKRRRHRSSAF